MARGSAPGGSWQGSRAQSRQRPTASRIAFWDKSPMLGAGQGGEVGKYIQGLLTNDERALTRWHV